MIFHRKTITHFVNNYMHLASEIIKEWQIDILSLASLGLIQELSNCDVAMTGWVLLSSPFIPGLLSENWHFSDELASFESLPFWRAYCSLPFMGHTIRVIICSKVAAVFWDWPNNPVSHYVDWDSFHASALVTCMLHKYQTPSHTQNIKKKRNLFKSRIYIK